MSKKIYTIADAREQASRRMPKIMFDYIDGAAGGEFANSENIGQLEAIRLQPRVLVNTENRNLTKTLLDKTWDLPFGIAPMGMCNLTWPDADNMLTAAAVKYNIPVGLSTMASSSIEDTFQRAGQNAWFQLYVGQSEEVGFEMVERAARAGYDTLMLTVDVPIVAPRPREQRNGFQVPFRMGLKQFIDFATHPQWSISTVLTGVPKVANNASEDAETKFVRNESRGKVDWHFLARLRERWTGKLIVKGVLSPDDAAQIRNSGADGVYVSNHGGRQLDSAPAAVQMLPLIREAVGSDFPILFDSGVRNGESVIKALALGADFVFLGRPFLYGMGADGETGLQTVIELIKNQIDAALAQLGRPDINSIDNTVIVP